MWPTVQFIRTKPITTDDTVSLTVSVYNTSTNLSSDTTNDCIQNQTNV